MRTFWILLAIGAASCTGTGDLGDDDSTDEAGDDDTADDDASDDDAGDDDASDDDASDDDSADDDTADDDTADDDAPTVTITAPAAGAIVEWGETVVLRADVASPVVAADALTVTFRSDLDGVLGTPAANGQGAAFWTTNALQPGWHTITVEACDPDGACGQDERPLGVCQSTQSDSFDADLSNWTLYGDAAWDASGFIELTGQLQSRTGQVFNTSERINPTDVAIRVDLQTGPYTDTGADGFAMSIIDALDVPDLEQILADSAPGGGLGYGFGPPYGPWSRDALHVEIDTWFNQINGTELHTDPTSLNHIAVTLDGDASNHLLWAEIPTIEDAVWHEVLLIITGSHVTVQLDGAPVLDGDLTGWNFRGGYIGFSGSTGFYTNNHRIRDLELLPECVVPTE